MNLSMPFIAYTSFRPIFIIFILFLVAIFLTISFIKKQNIISVFTVISFSIVSVLVSMILLYESGYIVDELGMSGDAVSSLMCIVIGILSVVNPIIYFYKRKK